MNEDTINGFEAFKHDGLTRVIDKITISKGNQINFPTAMYKRNHLDKYKAVLLYYKKPTREVGVEFLKDQDDGSFKLILSEAGKYGAYIVAKSFFFMNDLKAADHAARYTYKTVKFSEMGSDRTGSLYIINLDDKGGSL